MESTALGYKGVLEALRSLQKNFICPICLDVLEDTFIVPECQHRFCGKCIEESLRKCKNECPNCRIRISTRRTLRADDVFDGLVRNRFIRSSFLTVNCGRTFSTVLKL